MSWGWGTWKNRWEKADWKLSDFDEFIVSRRAKKLFNRGGDDLTDMLVSQKDGSIDSWSIRWDYTHYKHDAFCFCPVKSKIFNIGFDGTGVHCGSEDRYQSPLEQEETEKFEFPTEPGVEDHFVNAIRGMHEYSYKVRITKVLKRLMMP